MKPFEFYVYDCTKPMTAVPEAVELLCEICPEQKNAI